MTHPVSVAVSLYAIMLKYERSKKYQLADHPILGATNFEGLSLESF